MKKSTLFSTLFSGQTLKVCVFVLSVLFSAGAFGQTVSQSILTCTPAQSHCTSGDLSVVNVFVDLPACTSCTNNTISAPLKMTIHNGTKSERSAFALWGTLSAGATINGISGKIFVCVGAITVKSSDPGIPVSAGTGNQTFTVGTIVFNCSQALTLTDNLMAWTAANGSTATACTAFAAATNCADIEPKCGAVPSITIGQPLGASYTTTEGCTGASLGKIKVTPVGGTAPYTIVLKKNNVTVTTKTGATASGWEFTGLAEGTDYSAAITDASTPTACTYTLTPITLGSFFCCTAPTVGTNPTSTAVCSGSSASFTATPSGGDPAPTTQWQKKAPADVDFSNLTIASPYSLTNSDHTLNISNVTGLNNFHFRAVFTTEGCAPATSSDATLTVNPLPTANAGSAPASACFVSGATGNTFNLSGSGSNGTQSWSVQSKNPNTLTAVITNGNTYTPSVKVTGTTEGTVTLRLSVSTASCGTATSDVTVTTLAVPSEPDVTYIPPPTCTDATFKITVDNPHDGSTYTLRQLSGGIGPITKTAPANVVGGKITFEGLIPGKGYRVTETNGGGCISAPEACGDFSSVVGARMSPQSITNEETQTTTVKAYPNPFSDRVKFMVTSSVAGNGNLEVYNMMGQKVKTVYQGYITKGTQTFELSLPKQNVGNLVYVLRIGDKKMTGKILQLNQ